MLTSRVLENIVVKKEICIPIQNRKFGVVSKNQNIYECKEKKGKGKEF